MIRAEEILERRHLQSLAQAAAAGLPAGWRDLAPPRGKARTAAAVLLRLAEAATCEAMTEELAALTTCAERQAHHRASPGGEGAEDTEATLWNRLRDLVRALAPEPAAAGALAHLPAWSHLGGGGGGRSATAIERPFRSLLPADLPAREEVVAEAARILLRTTARAWTQEEERS